MASTKRGEIEGLGWVSVFTRPLQERWSGVTKRFVSAVSGSPNSFLFDRDDFGQRVFSSLDETGVDMRLRC